MRISKFLKKYFPVFALPTVLAFCLAFIIPFVMGLALSFTKFTTVTDAKWVGLENYVQAFTATDQDFIHSLWFTVKLTVVSVVTVNVFAFALASLLTKAIKGTNIFRTVFFMPNLIGGIVLGYVWQLIINGVLQYRGVTMMMDSSYGFWGLIILINWQMVGYMMIIYIAGIQNIPSDVLEAAEIDGAGWWTRLTKVTLPMVAPSITICTFLTLSNSFKLFDQNLALTAGGPNRETEGLALNIFNTFYGTAGYEGVGQAKAVVFFLMVAIIAFIQLRYSRSKEADA
jgi:raffinose/stachyose/melibiose transport system permease protein